jgi:hypothetical protein
MHANESFYTTKDGLLHTVGTGPHDPKRQAPEGYKLHIGVPPGFKFESSPFPGARWHVDRQTWVDTRDCGQKAQHALLEVVAARRAAYPPIEDFADAMYWQTQGDNSRMKDYMAACRAVKLAHPKPK